MSDKVKKPFNETGLGKFLKKAGGVIPDVVTVATQVATGNISGAFATVSGALKEKAVTDANAAALLQEFEMHRMTWELELEKVHAADRDSARNREIKLAEAGKKDWMPMLLAIAALVFFGFALYVIAFLTIPEGNREMFVHVLGIVEGAMLVNVYNYYFGSSAGSKRKTELTGK